MATLSLKIAYKIIIAGLFIIVSVVAVTYQGLGPGFYLVLSLLVAYVILFALAEGRNFTLPFRKILNKADDVDKGYLQSRIYLESKDELGQLATTFNKMASQLEESKLENEKTKKSVAVKVGAETEVLKEVVNALEQKIKNRTLELHRATEDMERFKEYAKEKEKELAELKNNTSEPSLPPVTDKKKNKENSIPKKSKDIIRVQNENQSQI